MNTDILELVEFLLTTEAPIPHGIRNVAFRVMRESSSPEACVYRSMKTVGGVAEVHVSDYEETKRLMANNRKIDAIKHIRRLTHLGLKEAKEAVEREFGY